MNWTKHVDPFAAGEMMSGERGGVVAVRVIGGSSGRRADNGVVGGQRPGRAGKRAQMEHPPSASKLPAEI